MFAHGEKKISLCFALHRVWKGNTCTKVFAWVSAREIYLFFDGRCCEFPERSMIIFNPHSTPSVSSQALHDKWMYLPRPSLGLPRSDWNKELRSGQNLISSFRCVQDFTHFLGKAWMRASMCAKHRESRLHTPPTAWIPPGFASRGCSARQIWPPWVSTWFFSCTWLCNGNGLLSPGKTDHAENKWTKDELGPTSCDRYKGFFSISTFFLWSD